MPRFQVSRTIRIDASPERVFDTVANFGTWPTWSPWLCIEPNAKVSIPDAPHSVGAVYRWKGELVGAGEIEHKRLDRPKRMDQSLRFLKPFKSEADVAFIVESKEGTSELTWQMEGGLPWFMSWMISSMKTYISMDYGRGLKMLKEFIETETVQSKTEVIGVENAKPIRMFGKSASCPIDEIGATMSKQIPEVEKSFSKLNSTGKGEMISVYHPICMKEGRFDFTSGFEIDSHTEPTPDLKVCELPAGKVLHLRHTGRYENLGNTWSGAYQYARHKKLKVKKADGYEIYRNDPDTTPTAELITDVYLPLK